MKLSEFFEELAYGEVSDLSMAEEGTIKPKDQPKIVIKLNDVLTNLYTKYVIKLGEVAVPAQTGPGKYTVTDPHSVRIVYVNVSPQEEENIYKNRGKFSLSGNTITFQTEERVEITGLQFQWKPLKLNVNPAKGGFLNQEIELDPVLVPLVRTLVASGLFMAMNGETHKKTGTELFNLAQVMTVDLENAGILSSSVGFASNQFEKNGFA